MAMEKVEYSFPHEDEDEKVIEVEPSSAEEIKKAKKIAEKEKKAMIKAKMPYIEKKTVKSTQKLE